VLTIAKECLMFNNFGERGRFNLLAIVLVLVVNFVLEGGIFLGGGV